MLAVVVPAGPGCAHPLDFGGCVAAAAGLMVSTAVATLADVAAARRAPQRGRAATRRAVSIRGP